jgi:hypothetical protein
MTFNIDIVKRAEAIAERDGRNWADCIEEAHIEANQPPLEKIVKKPDPRDAALRKKAVVAELRHMPGEGDPDPDRRVEIGEVETQLGRLRISVSREEIGVHGVNAAMSDIDADLRGAIVTTSASFAAAITDLEQTEQRTLIGFVMDAVLRRAIAQIW